MGKLALSDFHSSPSYSFSFVFSSIFFWPDSVIVSFFSFPSSIFLSVHLPIDLLLVFFRLNNLNHLLLHIHLIRFLLRFLSLSFAPYPSALVSSPRFYIGILFVLSLQPISGGYDRRMSRRQSDVSLKSHGNVRLPCAGAPARRDADGEGGHLLVRRDPVADAEQATAVREPAPTLRHIRCRRQQHATRAAGGCLPYGHRRRVFPRALLPMLGDGSERQTDCGRRSGCLFDVVWRYI